ncbi:MAG TPA: beta-N-acetylglucosaminidase, partial [Sphingobacteriaceae bacterium]
MEKKFIPSKMRKAAYPLLACVGLAVLSLGATYKSAEEIDNVRFVSEFKNVEKKTVLLNNQDHVLPLKGLEKLRIASINLGSSYASTFDSLLNKYTEVQSYTSTAYKGDSLSMVDLLDELKFKSTVIVQVTDKSLNDPETLQFLLDNQKNKQLVVVLLGHARSLAKLNEITAPVILTDHSEAAANFSAQLIFGGVGAKGVLSTTVSPSFTKGAGYVTQKTRLKYTVPEELGINSADLKGIDEVALEAIRERATPSAVVMVVKDGEVIFNKAYGTHTYEPEA